MPGARILLRMREADARSAWSHSCSLNKVVQLLGERGYEEKGTFIQVLSALHARGRAYIYRFEVMHRRPARWWKIATSSSAWFHLLQDSPTVTAFARSAKGRATRRGPAGQCLQSCYNAPRSELPSLPTETRHVQTTNCIARSIPDSRKSGLG